MLLVKEIRYPRTMLEYQEKCFAKIKQAFDSSGLSSHMEGCTSRLSMSMDIVDFDVQKRPIKVLMYEEIRCGLHSGTFGVPQYENRLTFRVKVNFQYYVFNGGINWYVNKFIRELDTLHLDYSVSPIEWAGDNLNGSQNFNASVTIDFSKSISDEEFEKIFIKYKKANENA